MGENLRRDGRSRAPRRQQEPVLEESPAVSTRRDTGARKPARRATRRRGALWLVGGVLAGGVALAGVLGVTLVIQALDVRDDLLAVKSSIAALGPLAEARDEAGLELATTEISARVSGAAATVSAPLWQVASQIPGVGVNVDAVSRVTRAADILVRDALPLGIEMLSDLELDRFTLDSGGVNLQPLVDARDALPVMAQAFHAAKAETDRIHVDAVLPEIAGPVDEIREVVDRAAPALDIANRYLPTLLDIAGADGPKKYLIVFQNNAEIRATGGNPSAHIIVDVDQGKFTLIDQGDPRTFSRPGEEGEQFTEIPDETQGLYPSTFARFPQDNTMTPDFPTTAQLFRDAYTAVNGGQVDGVMSIDPVVLSRMLEVAGPVEAAGQTMTSENAVRVLLSDAYQQFPTAPQSDAFFAAVSRAVFVHLTSTEWDPARMLDALSRSADEQRVYLSFTNAEAQQLSVELGLDGALRSDNATTTQVGTYVNDYSVGKLEYHLTQSVSAVCDVSARSITTTTTLTNSVPGTGRSAYTLGERNARYGLPGTAMMLDILFFAPPGAEIVSTDPVQSDLSGFDRSGSEKGNTAVSRLVVIREGESRTVTSKVQLPDGPLGPLELRYSPTASDTTVVIDGSCRSLFGA